VRKPQRKRPLGRQRHRCVDNIKTDLREIGWVVEVEMVWPRKPQSRQLVSRDDWIDGTIYTDIRIS
jgi:hypothetical protein